MRADPGSDFLTLARSAIGAPATLATVHSLYVYMTVRPANAGMGMPSVEGSMRRGAQLSQVAMWIAPPARYLVRSGSSTSGFDGDRLIGPAGPNGAELTNRFRHWALSLLFYDPITLGVKVTDRGATIVGKKPFHVVDATADGFEMLLYFDPDSHRLVMSEDSNEVKQIPGSTRRVAERDAYGNYWRVNGIELPFSIDRTTEGSKVGPVTILENVVKYVINPSDLDRQLKQ